MKVVLAHDFVRHGGAERVLEQLHALWPDAPILTLLAERDPARSGWDIRPSRLQRIVPPSRYRWPFFLYPGMVERRKVPADADLLVTSSVSWMKGLAAPPGVPHLCYIHRPMMFAYDRQDVFLARYPAPLRPILRAMAARIRAWDQRTAGRPDLYVANSRYTADRVRELYRREAQVVPPPVRVGPFLEAGRRTEPGDWFLTVQRLESYKRVDILVEACTRLGLRLKVAGVGPERARLQALAGPQIEFLGWVPEERLPDLVAGCRAFLFSAEEDFGIAPVEAQAAGRPVIAYAAGGCLETILPGRTGLLFEDQEAASLMAALKEFPDIRFDPDACRAQARRYSADRFREKILALAGDLVARGTGISAPAGPQS